MLLCFASPKPEESGILLRVLPLRQFTENEYTSQHVLLEARLANARIPLQIDVGFGDVITPEPVEIDYPTMLAFPKAKMRAYSKETVVAEKFEAIVKLGMANSRMKDFYDLWVMAGRFEFAGPVFAKPFRRPSRDGRLSCQHRVRWPLPRNFPRVQRNRHSGGHFCGRADWKQMRL